MISYDKARNQTVDSENGDYLECLEDHFSMPYSTFAIFNKHRTLLVIAELNFDGSRVIKTPEGDVAAAKRTLLKAWLPHKLGETRNFDVPQYLIDRLALFLKRDNETEFERNPPLHLNSLMRASWRIQNEQQSNSLCILESI